MGRLIDITNLQINIKDVYEKYYDDLIKGKIKSILLHSKNSIKLTLESKYASTNYKGEKYYFIVINVFNDNSKYKFQFSHPLVDWKDENFEWKNVYELYNEWKSYFDEWNEELEINLMECCGFLDNNCI